MRGLGTCVAEEGTNGVGITKVDGGFIINWTEAHIPKPKPWVKAGTPPNEAIVAGEADLLDFASPYPNFERKTAVRVELEAALTLVSEILTSNRVHRE